MSIDADIMVGGGEMLDGEMVGDKKSGNKEKRLFGCAKVLRAHGGVAFY